MAYATADDVRNLTGWTSGTITDAVLGSLIVFSDSKVDSFGIVSATAAQKQFLSALYAAHLGETRLKGNITDFSDEGMNLAYLEETRWLKEFNKSIIQNHGISFKKSWGL